MLDDLRRIFSDGLRVPLDDVVAGASPTHPECLCVVVLRDVSPEDMTGTLNRLFEVPGLTFTRALVQVVDPRWADRLRGLAFEAAFDASWDYLIATIRTE